MTKEELAKMLDGMEYRYEITPDIQHGLINSDLVVVYGYSDDNMEFRGAIDDEVSCYNGGTAKLSHINGLLLLNECDDDCPYFEALSSSAIDIEALWCKEDDYSWTYKTDIPHATFDILEDGEKYCRGIVFNLSDVEYV